MVRLKKKRFIILDYSIVPSPRDIAAAALSPQILCPNGAGKQKCVDPDCTKVGVPIMLYDSDPEQPSSLYLRSGLCFLCQRILNEKRRTQRKRKSDVVGGANAASSARGGGGGHHHHHHHHHLASGSLTTATDAAGNPLQGYHTDPAQKRFRFHGEVLDLNPDAIIINGPLEGTRHHEPGYEYPEISTDLQTIANNAVAQTAKLTGAALSLSPSVTVTADEENTNGAGNEITAARDEMLATYEMAFLGMSKGIFLLSQWKASWDAAVAGAAAEKVAAVAMEQQVRARDMQERQERGRQVGGLGGGGVAGAAILEPGAIADAVASAAAVAAAQSQSVGADPGGSGGENAHSHGGERIDEDMGNAGGDGGNGNEEGDEGTTSNMIPLLLAANATDVKIEALNHGNGRDIVTGGDMVVEGVGIIDDQSGAHVLDVSLNGNTAVDGDTKARDIYTVTV